MGSDTYRDKGLPLALVTSSSHLGVSLWLHFCWDFFSSCLTSPSLQLRLRKRTDNNLEIPSESLFPSSELRKSDFSVLKTVQASPLKLFRNTAMKSVVAGVRGDVWFGSQCSSPVIITEEKGSLLAGVPDKEVSANSGLDIGVLPFEWGGH